MASWGLEFKLSLVVHCGGAEMYCTARCSTMPPGFGSKNLGLMAEDQQPLQAGTPRSPIPKYDNSNTICRLCCTLAPAFITSIPSTPALHLGVDGHSQIGSVGGGTPRASVSSLSTSPSTSSSTSSSPGCVMTALINHQWWHVGALSVDEGI
jgi:hypothetical protein